MDRIGLELSGEEREESELSQEPTASLSRQVDLLEIGSERAGQAVDSRKVIVDEGDRGREQRLDAEVSVVDGAQQQLRRRPHRSRRLLGELRVVRGFPQNQAVAGYRERLRVNVE